jgi:hypothetical protein
VPIAFDRTSGNDPKSNLPQYATHPDAAYLKASVLVAELLQLIRSTPQSYGTPPPPYTHNPDEVPPSYSPSESLAYARAQATESAPCAPSEKTSQESAHIPGNAAMVDTIDFGDTSTVQTRGKGAKKAAKKAQQAKWLDSGDEGGGKNGDDGDGDGGNTGGGDGGSGAGGNDDGGGGDDNNDDWDFGGKKNKKNKKTKKQEEEEKKKQEEEEQKKKTTRKLLPQAVEETFSIGLTMQMRQTWTRTGRGSPLRRARTRKRRARRSILHFTSHASFLILCTGYGCSSSYCSRYTCDFNVPRNKS